MFWIRTKHSKYSRQFSIALAYATGYIVVYANAIENRYLFPLCPILSTKVSHSPAPSLGSSHQSHRKQGQTLQTHKIHRIFHKWMNTIFYQFPHYANMQNITFSPIRPPHSSNFNSLSCNCRNYQIITTTNCEYLWQIQQIPTQITFYSGSHWMQLELLSFFFCKV